MSGLLVAVLALVNRQLLFAVEAKERERRLVGEIEHRSKNILAVVASLIHQTVNDKEVADTLAQNA